MALEDRHERPPTRFERLVDYLTDGLADDPLASDIAGWISTSGAFQAFAETHRDKIRKKLRGARLPEARLDVRTELAVARTLLADRRFELGFEAAGATTGGPDFTVRFRGRRAFNLEVTRRRRPTETALHGGFLIAKLRQLPPGVPNAVLVAADGPGSSIPDLTALTRDWRARADVDEDDFFQRRGLAGARDFRNRLARLGGVFVVTDLPGDDRATLWTNSTARIALPVEAARAALVALRLSDT